VLKRKHAVHTPRLFTSATPAARTLAMSMRAAQMPVERVLAAHKVSDYVIAPFKAVLRECVV
jgi:hypothetical protein